MEASIFAPTAPNQADFHDLKGSFAHKSDADLQRAYWQFRLMKNPLLMKAITAASRLAVSLHLPINSIIKNTVYKQFCGGESLTEAMEVIDRLDERNISAVLDYAAESEETEEGFELALNHTLNNIAIARHSHGIGAVSVKMTALGHRKIFEKLSGEKPLNPEDASAYERTCLRLDTICEYAIDAGVSVYIDAEESWLQPAIDALGETMMGRYNRRHVVVFITLQLYRTDRLNYLQELLERADEKGYIPGIKLVRGAYWEKERARAAKFHYTSPVFPTKAKTDECFNKAVILCLENLPVLQLCLATHNEESLLLVLQEYNKRKLHPFRVRLTFSQLYGMSDHLSFALSQAGFRVSKYLPYGEVAKALPYLIRRAEENTAIAGQAGRELQLLEEEMHRRNLL